MEQIKKKKLEENGWKVGTTQDFLELSDEEATFIEMKVILSENVKKWRKTKKLTQIEFAKLINSSQSRIAKIESGDPSVSLDLLVRSLIALGARSKDFAKILQV